MSKPESFAEIIEKVDQKIEKHFDKVKELKKKYKPEAVLIKYLRDKKGNRIGVIASTKEDDKIYVGYSLCSPRDVFCKQLGLKIALERGRKKTNEILSLARDGMIAEYVFPFNSVGSVSKSVEDFISSGSFVEGEKVTLTVKIPNYSKKPILSSQSQRIATEILDMANRANRYFNKKDGPDEEESTKRRRSGSWREKGDFLRTK